MKKLLLTLITITTLISCEKNEVPQPTKTTIKKTSCDSRQCSHILPDPVNAPWYYMPGTNRCKNLTYSCNGLCAQHGGN
jgi:hypothetical protein